MFARVKLHVLCLCQDRARKGAQLRFHVAGIVREFVPRRWQEYVR